jgi:hypothetical protein
MEQTMKSWMSRTMVTVPILLALAVGPAIVGASTAGASLPSSVSYGTGSYFKWNIPWVLTTISFSGMKSGALTTTAGSYVGSFITAATQPIVPAVRADGVTVTITGRIKVGHSGTTITSYRLTAGATMKISDPGTEFTSCEATTLPRIVFTLSHGVWEVSTKRMTGVVFVATTGACTATGIRVLTSDNQNSGEFANSELNAS